MRLPIPSFILDPLAERVTLRLLDLLIEPVTERVLAQLANEPRWVDAATLARSLGLSRDFIYDHADELGAIRLGSSERPRLRFEVETARTAFGRMNGGA